MERYGPAYLSQALCETRITPLGPTDYEIWFARLKSLPSKSVCYSMSYDREREDVVIRPVHRHDVRLVH